MKTKPRCGRPQRFLLAQSLAKKLAPLGAHLDGKGSWKLVVRFNDLAELKDKRRRITALLRRYEGLIEERPGLLEALNKGDSGLRNRVPDRR